MQIRRAFGPGRVRPWGTIAFGCFYNRCSLIVVLPAALSKEDPRGEGKVVGSEGQEWHNICRKGAGGAGPTNLAGPKVLTTSFLEAREGPTYPVFAVAPKRTVLRG